MTGGKFLIQRTTSIQCVRSVVRHQYKFTQQQPFKQQTKYPLPDRLYDRGKMHFSCDLDDT